MIDPAKVALYKPDGLRSFKSELFDRIGAGCGRVIRGDVAALEALPDDWLPLVGCQPESTPLIAKWRASGRRWAYWDRGYARRVFATWLPRAESRDASYYRVHLGSFQMQSIRNVPDDRWRSMRTDVLPWQRNGKHIVIAAPTRTYARFHRCESWIADTIDALARVTDRQLVIRDKESKRDLRADLAGAHCLVTHGSIAAVESVVLGLPVFVHPDSAAALVGRTDLSMIEKPNYPDREPWLRSLAYCQYNETELVDGTLWRLIE
jgi:hypothetical protein